MEQMLVDVVIFLAAALIAVPLSVRLGFGAVLGYLLAGVAIGPWVLKLVTDVDAILHFAELGIVLMMFVIGLEMRIDKLWEIRHTIFGYGGGHHERQDGEVEERKFFHGVLRRGQCDIMSITQISYSRSAAPHRYGQGQANH